MFVYAFSSYHTALVSHVCNWVLIKRTEKPQNLKVQKKDINSFLSIHITNKKGGREKRKSKKGGIKWIKSGIKGLY